MSLPTDEPIPAAWFAGPKAENAPWFAQWLGRIVDDYYAWRRNYFPEDGVVVDSALRRQSEGFVDAFEDRLLELLARLKSDVPFHSPRYAAHMLAEQTLPSIAGTIAALLYNPNNVTSESAPVTVRLELEAGKMLCRMIGYPAESWAHLCSGGTLANFEALWIARSVRYLPLVVADARRALGLPGDVHTLGHAWRTAPPAGEHGALAAFARLWQDASSTGDGRAIPARHVRHALASSAHNVVERGVGPVIARLGSAPRLLVPESHHYCFEKALDLLGLGKDALVCVPVDHHFRMHTPALQLALDRVDAAGDHVLAVVAVVGSTEEGAVDPVDEIVALREARACAGKPSFWLHADGAYGGYLRTVTIPARIGLGEARSRVEVNGQAIALSLTLPEHAECNALGALPACDSVTIDPHKLGYIPYPAGAICFRSDLVKPLVRQAAPYLDDDPGDIARERRSDSVGLFALEGSKPGTTAAAVWLSHSLIPLDTRGHGRLIRANIRGACEFHALLEQFHRHTPSGADPRTRAVPLCAPGSNIVCYAFAPSRASSLTQINLLNRALYARFSTQSGQRVTEQTFFLSRTVLTLPRYGMHAVGPFLQRLGVSADEYAAHGVFLLRSVIMNPWLEQAKARGRFYLSELAADLFDAADELVNAAT